MTDWLNKCHFGDVRDVLQQMIADGVKVQTIVTSPPYWGLRSYLPADHPDKAREIGSEPTLGEFIDTMTEIFMLAREVLADDGTCWINMGDCYATGAGKVNTTPGGGTQGERWAGVRGDDKLPGIGPQTQPNRMPQVGLKPKDLAGQPWRLAFSMQDAGWWLRQDIIWAKRSPMPESVRDRFTKSHEYVFLMTKSEKYYFNWEAVKEPASVATNRRLAQDLEAQAGSLRAHAGEHRDGRPMKAMPGRAVGSGVGFGHGFDATTKPRAQGVPAGWATGTDRKHNETLGRYTEFRKLTPKALLSTGGDDGAYADGKSANLGRGAGWRKNNDSFDEAMAVMPATRNPRSVRYIDEDELLQFLAWKDAQGAVSDVLTLSSEPFKGAHFATYPAKLIRPFILAGCPPGGVVLDIFMGSGTTAQVAEELGCQWIGIDIDVRNRALQAERLQQPSLALEAAA